MSKYGKCGTNIINRVIEQNWMPKDVDSSDKLLRDSGSLRTCTSFILYGSLLKEFHYNSKITICI